MRNLLVVMVVAGAALPARADVVVRGVAGDAQGAERVVSISKRGIRMDEGDQTHIVDAHNRLLIELDHKDRTVRRMSFRELGDRTRIAREQADEAVARARVNLEQYPPEIRAQVEAAIRAQQSAMEARKPGAYERKPTGKKRTVNGFACEEVKELLNGQWVGSACVHRDFKLPEADRRMLVELAKEMQRAGLSGSGTAEVSRAFLDGIPVEMSSRHPRTGELAVEERVTSIKATPVPDALFQVPRGYREVRWSAVAEPHH